MCLARRVPLQIETTVLGSQINMTQVKIGVEEMFNCSTTPKCIAELTTQMGDPTVIPAQSNSSNSSNSTSAMTSPSRVQRVGALCAVTAHANYNMSLSARPPPLPRRSPRHRRGAGFIVGVVTWFDLDEVFFDCPPPSAPPMPPDTPSDGGPPPSPPSSPPDEGASGCSSRFVMNANAVAAAEAAIVTLAATPAGALSTKLGVTIPVAPTVTSTPTYAIKAFLQPPSPPPPPQEPPISPPPPSPPSPPAPPPGICTNTCAWPKDGECDSCSPEQMRNGVPILDDWGDPVCCEDGTDCADCGVHIYCADCSDECAALAVEHDLDGNPENACMQTLWDDGVCDTQCNNRQCGHNDCTPKQVIDKCWTEQQLWREDLTTPPNGLGTPTPVAALVKLDQVSLAIDEDLNEVIATWNLAYHLQWQDARVFTSPCALQLDSLLSISPEEAKSEVDMKEKRMYQKMFWLPTAVFDRAQENVMKISTFNASANQPPLNGVFREPCEHCISYRANHKLRIKQRFKYFKYPFDEQDISLFVRWPGASLQSLELLLGKKMPSSDDLLPSTGEWLPDGSGTEWVVITNQELTLEDDDEDSGAEEVTVTLDDGAEITFKVARNPMVFLIKQLAMAVAIVSGGLLALWLHPTEYAGDRSAWIVVAVLIVMTFLQADLGLGKLYYLIWVDLLNLMFVFILVRRPTPHPSSRLEAHGTPALLRSWLSSRPCTSTRSSVSASRSWRSRSIACVASRSRWASTRRS